MTQGTEQQESAAAERAYLGEPAPRRPAVAFALSMLSPGLGFAYAGQPGVAIVFGLASSLLWLGFVGAWISLKFYPTLPFIGFAVGWLVWLLAGAWDAARVARSEGTLYVLRESNHPVAYVALALLTFVFPVGGLAHWTLHDIWERVEVRGDSMYPTLVDGDTVWVERWAYRGRLPQRGDVVAYRAAESGDVAFARVVGLPGDQVVVSEHAAFVNDTPMPQRHLDANALEAVEALSGARDATTLLSERTGHRVWVVSTSSQMDWGPAWTSEPGEQGLVLLHDARPDLGDSRTFGAIDLEQLIGRPRYIAGHASDLAPGEQPRTARRVQPAIDR